MHTYVNLDRRRSLKNLCNEHVKAIPVSKLSYKFYLLDFAEIYL